MNAEPPDMVDVTEFCCSSRLDVIRYTVIAHVYVVVTHRMTWESFPYITATRPIDGTPTHPGEGRGPDKCIARARTPSLDLAKATHANAVRAVVNGVRAGIL